MGVGPYKLLIILNYTEAGYLPELSIRQLKQAKDMLQTQTWIKSKTSQYIGK